MYSRSESDIYLYEFTDFDKTWLHFFSSENFEELKNYEFRGQITFKELSERFSKKHFSKISSAIQESIPLNLEPEELPNKFKITNSFTKKSDISKRVRRVTKPIIIDDLAIIFVKFLNEGQIHFLQKNEKQKWEVIYMVYIWLILE